MALRPRAGSLTRAGLHKLEAELKQAEEVRLPEFAQRLRTIRQMAADLSESGEYYQALDELSQLQARIAELRFAIGSGEVTEEGPVAPGRMHPGSIVTLALNGDQETYQVVGSVEADPDLGGVAAGQGAAGAHGRRPGEVDVPRRRRRGTHHEGGLSARRRAPVTAFAAGAAH